MLIYSNFNVIKMEIRRLLIDKRGQIVDPIYMGRTCQIEKFFDPMVLYTDSANLMDRASLEKTIFENKPFEANGYVIGSTGLPPEDEDIKGFRAKDFSLPILYVKFSNVD